MKIFKLLFLFCLLTLPFLSRAQQTEYLDGDRRKTEDRSQAKYYQVTTYTDSIAGNVKTYLMNGLLVEEETFADIWKGIFEGVNKTWFEENGQLKFDLNYKAGKYDGSLRSYYRNGKLKRDDVYKDGMLVKGRCLTKAGKDTAFYEFETKPVFPGGEDKMLYFISTNVHYPKRSQKDGVEGLVVASFVVNTNGTISGTEILKSINKELDQEVIRMISTMPRWKPGFQDGKKVRVRFTLPVRFALN